MLWHWSFTVRFAGYYDTLCDDSNAVGILQKCACFCVSSGIGCFFRGLFLLAAGLLLSQRLGNPIETPVSTNTTAWTLVIYHITLCLSRQQRFSNHSRATVYANAEDDGRRAVVPSSHGNIRNLCKPIGHLVLLCAASHPGTPPSLPACCGVQLIGPWREFATAVWFTEQDGVVMRPLRLQFCWLRPWLGCLREGCTEGNLERSRLGST